MYRDRGGSGSKTRSSTATSSRPGLIVNGKDGTNNNNNNNNRLSPSSSKLSSLSRSSYPNKKLSKDSPNSPDSMNSAEIWEQAIKESQRIHQIHRRAVEEHLEVVNAVRAVANKMVSGSTSSTVLRHCEGNIVEESETDSEESDVSGSDGEDTSWISWFCNLRGNEFFCEVDENYIQDDFNLCGLSSQVPYYDYALDLILDAESSHGDMFSEEQNEIIESAAEMLYGLIHVRYILTTKGLNAMLDKYKNAEFGRCPRVYCCGHPCLPVGQSDVSRQSNVKIFCPKCEDIYTPQSRFQDNLDGAYFGSTFPHLFLMTYGHLKPQKPSQDYIPRVFGFKVHKP